VHPANDQAPTFKATSSNIELQHGGSLVLARDLFDVEDADTPLDNLIFTIEKAPDSLLIELRAKGQRYVISKDDSFNMQEIRDGTFRLVHNLATAAHLAKDSFKISASDNKHITVKTVHVTIKIADQLAPQVSNRTSMLLTLKEGQNKHVRREHLAFSDDHSTADEIVYKLVAASANRNKTWQMVGKLFKKSVPLAESMQFTQADVDLQNIRYEAPGEIGSAVLVDEFVLDVVDKEGNTNANQVFTVKVEPVDNQPPVVDMSAAVVGRVEEGGYLLFNESLIQIRDSDSAREQLSVIVDSQPSFGHLENTQKGK
jgi:hypothetical protein